MIHHRNTHQLRLGVAFASESHDVEQKNMCIFDAPNTLSVLAPNMEHCISIKLRSGTNKTQFMISSPRR